MSTNAFKTAKQRFEALQTRERLLIIMVAVVLIWAVAQLLYFSAAEKREKALRSTSTELRQQIMVLEANEVALRAQLAEDGVAALHARRDELKRQRAALDAELQQQGLKLLDPVRMREVLHDLLQGSGLRLMSLTRMPVELAYTTETEETATTAEKAPAAAKVPSSTAKRGVTLYRHAVQIELEGSYADMVSYLERLEQSGWHLMWQSLDIETREYPTARMRLTVYTLGLDKEWMGV